MPAASPPSCTTRQKSASATRARARRTPSASIGSACRAIRRCRAVSPDTADHRAGLQHVPRRPRVRRHDRHVAAGQRIDQRRFAHIRRAGDRDHQPSRSRSPRRPSSRCAAISPHTAAISRSIAASVAGGRSSSGKSISASCCASSRVRRCVHPYTARRARRPFAAAPADAGRRSRPPQVGDRLGLQQVHPPVEEGASGELSGFRRPRAAAHQRVRHGVEHRPPAMHMQFARILAGIACRSRQPEHQGVVQHLAPGSRSVRNDATRAVGRGRQSRSSTAPVAAPLSRTTATAARPAPEATAKIVSVAPSTLP